MDVAELSTLSSLFKANISEAKAETFADNPLLCLFSCFRSEAGFMAKRSRLELDGLSLSLLLLLSSCVKNDGPCRAQSKSDVEGEKSVVVVVLGEGISMGSSRRVVLGRWN